MDLSSLRATAHGRYNYCCKVWGRAWCRLYGSDSSAVEYQLLHVSIAALQSWVGICGHSGSADFGSDVAVARSIKC